MHAQLRQGLGQSKTCFFLLTKSFVVLAVFCVIVLLHGEVPPNLIECILSVNGSQNDSVDFLVLLL